MSPFGCNLLFGAASKERRMPALCRPTFDRCGASNHDSQEKRRMSFEARITAATRGYAAAPLAGGVACRRSRSSTRTGSGLRNMSGSNERTEKGSSVRRDANDPGKAALCRGVSPVRFLAFGSAPLDSRNFRKPDVNAPDVFSSVVLPNASRPSTSAPPSSRTSAISMSDHAAARWSGVCPFLSLAFGSAFTLFSLSRPCLAGPHSLTPGPPTPP